MKSETTPKKQKYISVEVSYHGAGVVLPRTVLVKVLLDGMVDLVRHLVQLEHEREVGKSTHLHLRSLRRVPIPGDVNDTKSVNAVHLIYKPTLDCILPII